MVLCNLCKLQNFVYFCNCMTNQSETSYKMVTLLRFPLIMAVVLIHCNFTGKAGPDALSAAPVFAHVVKFLNGHVYSLAVPLFFFISGYLFFREGVHGFDSLMRKLRRRVKTLLVPYLLWNTIGLALFLLKLSPWLREMFPQYAGYHLTLPHLLEGYIAVEPGGLQMPYDMSLWFIRNLIMVLAVSPLINLMFRYLRVYAIAIPLILSHVFPEFAFAGFSSMYFFMLGALAPVARTDLAEIAASVKFYAAAIWIASVALSAWTGFNSILITTVGLIAVLQVGYSAVEKGWKIPEMLNESTFFIYAFHALYISAASAVVLRILPPTGELAATTDYLLIFLLLAGGAYIAFRAMRLFAPRSTRMLCGGRGNF